jgi:hypothetical protein
MLPPALEVPIPVGVAEVLAAAIEEGTVDDAAAPLTAAVWLGRSCIEI